MRLIIHMAVVASALAATAYAQDTTVKSRTTIDADEAQVVSMTGCLRQDPVTGTYMLVGKVDAAGDRVRNDAKLKIDVDKDERTVTADTRSKTEKGGKADKVAAGQSSTYVLAPGNVSLAPHVGHQVQLAAATVKDGHKDAEVKIDDKTNVDPEHGRDHSSRATTTVEIERGPLGQYTVVSLKSLGDTCAATR